MSDKRTAVFLDRDGTLNEEVDFVRTPEQLRMIPGAAEAVRHLNERELLTCIISNQSGVARGLLTEMDLDQISHKLREELQRGGARIDAIYYCPHHPTAAEGQYAIECDCRKPKPGMLLRAAQEHNIDLLHSFLVGDSLADIKAGNAVGSETILVRTGYGKKSQQLLREQDIPVSFIAETIVEAVDFILEKHGALNSHG